ncbi:MAG: L-2-amino-thiazoline-4-carboxylic acid hydrolase [Salinivirgaceae bacterium]|jgi:hypothetical protein|nr:L-2-amino-thiazoline-4-carboxylic acid hydrolase [Salinivirgaceae bacterium]
MQQKVANISSSLIIRGILKGYVSNPMLLLIKAKFSFKKAKRTLKISFPQELVDSLGFIAWLYIQLCEMMEKQKAFEIIRVCLLSSGFAVQQTNFRTVEAERTFKNLIKFQQLANKQGSTKLNTIQILEESETKYEFRVTRCVFHELFSCLKVPELTSIMCTVDNAIFNSYLPDELTFHRNGLNMTIADGKQYCDFVIENNNHRAYL